MKNIFPELPKITDKDITRLTGLGLIAGWNKVCTALAESPPSEDDLRRLILIELGTESPRRQIIVKLAGTLRRLEKEDLFDRIRKIQPNLGI